MAINANALTTRDNAKTWLKIPPADLTQDPVVDLLVNGFSAEIEALTGRKLKSQSHTEVHHGRGSNFILLHEWPVTAVASLVIDSSGQFTAPAVPAGDYAIADDQNSIVILSGSFPRGYHNIRVIYTAGYATVPSDLEQAVLDLCFWRYRTRESGDIGRKQKGKASESEQWHQEWPPSALAVAMRYKRTEMPNLDSPVSNY